MVPSDGSATAKTDKVFGAAGQQANLFLTWFRHIRLARGFLCTARSPIYAFYFKHCIKHFIYTLSSIFFGTSPWVTIYRLCHIVYRLTPNPSERHHKTPPKPRWKLVWKPARNDHTNPSSKSKSYFCFLARTAHSCMRSVHACVCVYRYTRLPRVYRSTSNLDGVCDIWLRSSGFATRRS